jgi:heme-degrading monooxygenase HmoA
VYARVHTLETTPESHDEGVRIIRDQLMPWTRESTGFRGLVGLADKARTTALVITFWDDEESFRASEQAGTEFSKLTASLTGATRRSMDEFEVTLFELP